MALTPHSEPRPELVLTGSPEAQAQYRAVISNIATATSEPATVTLVEAGTPVMSISRAPNDQVTISWTGTGVLQETSSLPGGWTSAANQANPQTRAASGGAMFFRVVRQ